MRFSEFTSINLNEPPKFKYLIIIMSINNKTESLDDIMNSQLVYETSDEALEVLEYNGYIPYYKDESPLKNIFVNEDDELKAKIIRVSEKN